ncbi:hypothetical protein SB49_06425 [Sediminicola sp. YIK13]|nr:hypothetical protein SB49_06425 [Sediminicola sp. YIK13]
MEWKQKSSKAPAFTFLFAPRVHWDSPNPVLANEFQNVVLLTSGNKKRVGRQPSLFYLQGEFIGILQILFLQTSLTT